MASAAPPALALVASDSDASPIAQPKGVLGARSSEANGSGSAEPREGPPTLTCVKLYEALSDIELTPELASKLLTAHLPSVLHTVSPAFRPTIDGSALLLRRDAETTRAVPKPGPIEVSHAQAISAHLRIPLNDAQNLLRDFLAARLGSKGAVDTLQAAHPIASVAPLVKVEEFWQNESRYSHMCLVRTAMLSGHTAPANFRNELSGVIEEYMSDIEGIAVDRTCTILARHTATTLPPTRSGAFTNSVCVVEVLFALASAGHLRPSSFVGILKCLLDAASAAAAKTSFSSYVRARNVALRALLDDSFAILCLSASIIGAIGILLETDETDMSMPCAGTRTVKIDTETVAAIDGALLKSSRAESAEVALLSFLWGSICGSRKRLGDSSFDAVDPTQHVQYAARLCVTKLLTELLLDPSFAQHDDTLCDSLRSVYWDGICNLYVGFPPLLIPRPCQEVLDDVVCVATLLDGSPRLAHAAASQFWLSEYSSDAKWIGANAIVRVASAIFPFHFVPLIQLLTGFCTDADAGMEVVTTLEQRLCTCMEPSRSYYESLERVGDFEIENMRNMQHDMENGSNEKLIQFFRMATLVSHGSGDSTSFLVRPRDSISSHNVGILQKQRDIAVLSGNPELIIWSSDWNGWQAVAGSLKVAHALLSNPDYDDSEERNSYANVITAAAASLELIERVCHLGSGGTRDYVNERIVSLELISSLFNSAANFSRRSSSRSSRLIRGNRAIIAAGAGSCLHAMTLGSIHRSCAVLDLIIGDDESTSAMHTCVAGLGVSSFPSLSSLAMIAGTSLAGSDGNRHFSSTRDMEVKVTSHKDHPNSNAVRVCQYVTAVGLPLWVSLHENGYPNRSGPSVHWLLPAASFELCAHYPDEVVDSEAVADVVALTLTLAGPQEAKLDMTRDLYLFPALYRAVSLCISTLKRHYSDRANERSLERSLATFETREDSTNSTPAFYRMMIRHDVIHSLASIASGTSRVRAIFAQAKALRGSAYSRAFFMVDGEGDLDLLCIRLENMASACLTLLVRALHERSKLTGHAIMQIPWPAMGESSLGKWRGGGEVIRHGFAVKVQSSCTVHVSDFLAQVVACGQRAASRGLFGPSSVARENYINNETAVEVARPEGDLLVAIVDRMDDLKASWIRTIDESGNETSALAQGQIALAVAGCVRLLRCIWEVYGRVWLRAAWSTLNVWRRLAGLLRCGSTSTQLTTFDVGIALRDGPSYKETTHNVWSMSWDENYVRSACKTADSQATWRAIVADVFGIFSYEVGFWSRELLSLRRAALHSQSTESNSASGAQELDRARRVAFDDPAFIALRESFTEQWMVTFLDSRHINCIRSNILPGGLFDLRQQTVEAFSLQLSKEVQALTGKELTGFCSDILPRCCEGACGSLRYGAEFSIDIEAVEASLRASSVTGSQLWRILGLLSLLNVRLSRADAQAHLSKAFGSLTTLMVVTDIFAPGSNKMLTYASPQYCGKLSRVLIHYLTDMKDESCVCPFMLPSQAELAMLLGFVSSRITPEELEQAALSSIRSSGLVMDSEVPELMRIAPLGRIALVIGQYAQYLRKSHALADSRRRHAVSIVHWLLVSGSRLAPGLAFRDEHDLSAFASAAVLALRYAAADADICSSVGISLSAIVFARDDTSQILMTRKDFAAELFGAITTLVTTGDSLPDEKVCAVTSLVLMMTRTSSQLWGIGSVALLDKLALQHLSSGSIAALLPSGSNEIPAYCVDTLRREPIHRLWCSILSFASSLIAQVEPRLDPSGPSNAHLDGVLEFASSNFSRIAAIKLENSRDWPPAGAEDRDHSNVRFTAQEEITMARVEEAEVGMATVFSLSGHTLDLRDTLPHVINSFIRGALQFVFHAYRLIRAEPLERWVRAVSTEERERLDTSRVGKDSLAHPGVPGMRGPSSPWAASPVGSPGGVSTSPSPRRTPQEALRAALGGLPGRTAFSTVPPSPGMPSTPQHHSPMPAAPGARSIGTTGSYQSPLSPWSQCVGGLITGTGFNFGEEVTRSVLRGIGFALGALRRFSTLLDRPVFAPTMAISEDVPSVGLLVGIQFHACNEVQRGAEGERREALMAMIDNALHLALTHAMYFSSSGLLTAGLRDEMHKRIDTVVKRIRRVVPPPPSYSVVHSLNIDRFLQFLKSS